MVLAAGGRGATASEAQIIEAIKLCLDHGVDVDAFNSNGQTILHAAVQRNSIALIKFLAERGAKLDMKNKQGQTPLDLATGAGGPGLGGRGARGGAAPPPAAIPGGGGGAAREATATLLRELIAARK
jgi:hypothetical protein